MTFNVQEHVERERRQQQQRQAPAPFPVATISELLRQETRHTLVKGFAGRGETLVFYGPPKQGKTFLACHFAVAVATGLPWFERTHKAPPGFALYCALEGGAGMRGRLQAILKHDPATGDRLTDANFLVMRERIDLRQPADLDRLNATLRKHESATALPCLLVVIDTVARALGSGSDSDPKDMAALVAAADAIRQAGTQPTVLLVHHSGKDVARGPRGHSSLPGALDTCILVERLENGAGNRATCEYAKDDPDGWAIDFRLEQVELDEDEDGDPITTCIVREGDAHRIAPNKTKAKAAGSSGRLGRNQKIVFDIVHKMLAAPDVTGGPPHHPAHGKPCVRLEHLKAEARRVMAIDAKHFSSRFATAVDSLTADRHLTLYDGLVWK